MALRVKRARKPRHAGKQYLYSNALRSNKKSNLRRKGSRQ